jgi:hypothetical protein
VPPYCFARADQCTEQVDVDDVADGVGARHIEPRILAADAGRVHEMGDRPERARGLVEHPHDVGLFRHVALNRDAGAAGLLYGTEDFGCGVGAVEVIDRDIVATRRGKPRRRRADAAAAAGDEKNGSRHCGLLDLRVYPG